MRSASPFDPRVVFGLLVVGAAALLLFLYSIAAGLDGADERDGGAHAAANGLNGFAALAALLERRGHAVALSRSPARLDERALLVLTPPHFADGDALAELLIERRWQGPTLLILPKWLAIELPEDPRVRTPAGWVRLADAQPPGWLEELDALADLRVVAGQTRGWRGLGHAGTLPRAEAQALEGRPGQPLVMSRGGAVLATVLPPMSDGEGSWPLVIVAEPDLLNNQGLANPERAALAVTLVEIASGGAQLPIIFDLTLPGLGRAQNLLTLAFAPPFLAATLCLLLAAIVVGWRGFRRFGPPTAEAPHAAGAQAFGKRQLALSSAALVERARRLHLLGPPYAALMTRRIAARLGSREHDELALARLLAPRGAGEDFTARIAALRGARTRRDLLHAARDLNAFERTLAR